MRKNQIREARPLGVGSLVRLYRQDGTVVTGRLELAETSWYLVEADDTGQFLADPKAAEDSHRSNTSSDSTTNPSRITNGLNEQNTT